MTINRIYCGLVVRRPGLRRLDQLVHHRRRVSGRRARRTSTSSTPACSWPASSARTAAPGPATPPARSSSTRRAPRSTAKRWSRSTTPRTPTTSPTCPLAGYVPFGDASGRHLRPASSDGSDRGRWPAPQASQGDVWWMSWDGDPTLNAGRKHPLGVVVETRGMGWNFPTGNEDIIYFIYTFYNVTSHEPGGLRRHPPGDRGRSCSRRRRSSTPRTTPPSAWTCPRAATRSRSCTPPSRRTWTWPPPAPTTPASTCPSRSATPTTTRSRRFAGWTFDPTIFAPPFLPGAGFAGIKYLKSPDRRRRHPALLEHGQRHAVRRRLQRPAEHHPALALPVGQRFGARRRPALQHRRPVA